MNRIGKRKEKRGKGEEKQKEKRQRGKEEKKAEKSRERWRGKEEKNQGEAGKDSEGRERDSGKSRKMIVEGKETIERWKKQSKGKKRRIHCVIFSKE